MYVLLIIVYLTHEVSILQSMIRNYIYMYYIITYPFVHAIDAPTRVPFHWPRLAI
jgi:hypothetical protein